MNSVKEKVTTDIGSSLRVKRFESWTNCPMHFWHHHPEYELVYIHKGSGQLHIGNSTTTYDNGVLIFMGPDIPHLPFTNNLKADNYEILVQLEENFMGAGFLERPETLPLRKLLEKSRQGLTFHGKTQQKAGELLLKLLEAEPLMRLAMLLELFDILIRSDEYKVINSTGSSLAIKAGDFDRMKSVYQLVSEKYMEEITLEEVARLSNLTVPSFCRLFKKLTSKTFTRFVNEYRISKAIELLSTEDCTITDAGYRTGFKSISYFSRQFKQITNRQPSEFRKSYQAILTS